MITGVILTHNEQTNIVECIKCLRPHVSEVILVDTESADQTVSLAMPLVDRVLFHPHVPNFDSARNIAIPEAKNDWLWFVDADEFISLSTGELVNSWIREQGHAFEAINIPFKSYFCGRWMQHCGWWPGYTCPRVLKRGFFRFSETLHGGVELDGREVRAPATEGIGIEHRSFRDLNHWIEKFNRYTATEALQLANRGVVYDWRGAIRFMVHDLWEHYEKFDARLDGERGWILTWCAALYRWMSVTKLIDHGRSPEQMVGIASVPANLDEVFQAFGEELAFFRKNEPTLPLGVVIRSARRAGTVDLKEVRSWVRELAHQRRSVKIETSGSEDWTLDEEDALVWAFSGRVQSTINALGNRTTSIYDSANRALASVDPLGIRTTLMYDSLNRVVGQVDGLGNITTTVYDAASRFIALRDARGNLHTFSYDAIGQQVTSKDQLGKITTSVFDAGRRQTLRIDALANRTTYTFDAEDQQIGRLYPDGSRVTFAYDVRGSRTQMRDATGLYTFTFDAVGQVNTVHWPLQGVTTYVFNEVGQRTSLVRPNDGRLTYSCDPVNRLESHVSTSGQRTTFSYDSEGRMTLQRLANNTRVSSTYDSLSQLTQMVNLKSDGTVISSVEYGYDARGNRISMREATGGRVTWSYDRAQRLVNEFRSGASSYNTTYTYDATGNCLVKIKTGVRTTSTFDAANQLKTATEATGVTNYTFDANGNQQIIVSPSGNRTTYVWNYENQNTLVRLPSGARVTMAYNADQRRIRKDS